MFMKVFGKQLLGLQENNIKLNSLDQNNSDYKELIIKEKMLK